MWFIVSTFLSSMTIYYCQYWFTCFHPMYDWLVHQSLWHCRSSVHIVRHIWIVNRVHIHRTLELGRSSLCKWVSSCHDRRAHGTGPNRAEFDTRERGTKAILYMMHNPHREDDPLQRDRWRLVGANGRIRVVPIRASTTWKFITESSFTIVWLMI